MLEKQPGTKTVKRRKATRLRQSHSDPDSQTPRIAPRPSPSRSPSVTVTLRAPPPESTVAVAGIGASAGGLKALTELLRHLPTDTGMAFVIVQHLAPDVESQLPKLLAQATAMPVSEADRPMRLEPNHVYVTPPNVQLTVAHGRLKPRRPREEGDLHHGIDTFFTSLAQEARGPKIGVVLSGAGHDGTVGLEAIQSAGGITLAQEPKSAEFDSMPRHAIRSGNVDFILPPDQMAQELAELGPRLRLLGSPAGPLGAPEAEAKAYRELLHLLWVRTGLDSTLQPAEPIRRRLARRMVLTKAERLGQYLALLRHNPAEVAALYEDMLVRVAGFWTDPAALTALQQKVFPRILGRRQPDETVRIWVVGCGTGQEVYSLAMALLEYAGRLTLPFPVQIFATDVNDRMLERARNGLYSKAQVQGLRAERLARFFVEEPNGYRISRYVRELCVFARHDPLCDPAYSRMDLISCRLALSSLQLGMREQLLPALYYALKPGAFLFLGRPGEITGLAERFVVEDQAHGLYVKKGGAGLGC